MLIKILMIIFPVLLLCCIYSFIPLLLFLIPKTRNSTSFRVRLWKCVPFGIASAHLFLYCVSEICGNSIWKFSLIFMVPLLVIAVLFAVGVPFLLWQWMKKRYGNVEEKEKNTLWQKICFWNERIGFVLTIYFANMILYVFYSILLFFGGILFYGISPQTYCSMQKWNREVPVMTNPAAVLEARSIHPFLAEYDYRLRFDTEKGKVYQFLHCNTGGSIRFNIYKLKDGRFLWKDRFCSYIADHKTGTVWRLMEGRKGVLYYALIPNELENSFGGTVINDKDVEFERNGKKLSASPVGDLLKDKTFVGSINSRHGARFYPGGENEPL